MGSWIGVLKNFLRVEQNGDWPVIDQLHLHHFLKPPGFTAHPGSADAFHEVLIKVARFLGRSGSIERRTLAAADVAVERELRDHQNSSSHLRYRAIHLSSTVFKNAQPSDFVRQVTGIRFSIGLTNS